MNVYDIGNLIRCPAVFRDSTGTAVDPTNVYFEWKNPANTTTVYHYGVDVEVVKSATGNYYVDVDGNAEGRWYYRWYSTGTGQAAQESSFTVGESAF